MASNQKNKSRTKCWLTCLFNLKSATILSNGENLKMYYYLKGLPMKALEARSETGWFG